MRTAGSTVCSAPSVTTTRGRAACARQQRNVVLHPEFVDSKYALYTRPQDGFIDTGSGGGIGWGLVEDMTNAVLGPETIIDPRYYHTIREGKTSPTACAPALPDSAMCCICT